MKLTDLHIHNLRNIQNRKAGLHSSLNFIVGPNGSGKTSFLEAIYLISTGRSFRSREIAHLVKSGHEQLQIFVKTEDETEISLQKSIHDPMIAKINLKHCNTTSELAYVLPCQLLYQDIFQIFDAGPGVRRSLLDWGLFHVEHSYHSLLKDYRRVLQQRNALLKSKGDKKELYPWNQLLSQLSLQIDEKRKNYFKNFYSIFLNVLEKLSPIECKMTYFKGWDRKNEGKSLAEILDHSYQSDCLRQFTQYGAHQADISLETEDKKAKHFFSRGQQKICLFAMKLAQVQLIHRKSLVLIDDLMSELDYRHVDNILQLIQSMDSQFFITCQPEDLPMLKNRFIIEMS